MPHKKWQHFDGVAVEPQELAGRNTVQPLPQLHLPPDDLRGGGRDTWGSLFTVARICCLNLNTTKQLSPGQQTLASSCHLSQLGSTLVSMAWAELSEK